MRAMWSMLGPVPILAFHVATMPVEQGVASPPARDTWVFVGVTAGLAVLRVLYTILLSRQLIPPKQTGWMVGGLFSDKLALAHAGVQVLCACTLFLLFCQVRR